MSLEVMLTVFFLPPSRSRLHNLEASLARRSKISLQNELMTDMDLEEMPVSGWTCFSTFSGLALGTTDFSAFLED